jgi:hypothetical protein
MRRFLATFLLVIYSSFMGAPLLASSFHTDSTVPACCRRDGKHQCLMQTSAPTFSSATAVFNTRERCPSFPKAITSAQNQQNALAAGARFYADLVSHPACTLQTEARYRIASDRSRHKRGPPVSLL